MRTTRFAPEIELPGTEPESGNQILISQRSETDDQVHHQESLVDNSRVSGRYAGHFRHQQDVR